jgi:hypothetical protein
MCPVPGSCQPRLAAKASRSYNGTECDMLQTGHVRWVGPPRQARKCGGPPPPPSCSLVRGELPACSKHDVPRHHTTRTHAEPHTFTSICTTSYRPGTNQERLCPNHVFLCKLTTTKSKYRASSSPKTNNGQEFAEPGVSSQTGPSSPIPSHSRRLPRSTAPCFLALLVLAFALSLWPNHVLEYWRK